jgi:sulfate adenylyltransferase subunit 1
MIVPLNNQPVIEQEFEALLCWMDNKPLIPGNKYLLQINSRVVRSVVKEIEYKLDVNTLQKNYSPEKAVLNDIIKATIKTASPIAYDSYKKLRQNGGAILIDETSCVTVGACMLQ